MNHISKFLPTALVLELVVLLMAYVECQGDTTLFFQSAARLSGRISLLCFAFLFIYATLQDYTKPDRAVLHITYILTRNFMIIHVIHWVLLANAVMRSGFDLVPMRLVGGALAYGMILLLPFILKEVKNKTLDYKIFKTIPLRQVRPSYLTYVWLIFLMTYVSRVNGSATHVTGSMGAYTFLIVLTIALMLWRLYMLWHKRKIRIASVSRAI